MWWELIEEIAPRAEEMAGEKEIACCVRGYHVYKDIWAAAIQKSWCNARSQPTSKKEVGCMFEKHFPVVSDEKLSKCTRRCTKVPVKIAHNRINTSERMIETATGIVHLTCIVTCSANRHT